MKKKIITILLFLLTLVVFTSCGSKTQTNSETSNKQVLDIFRTDLKLEQEQVASKIKAEYLLKNKGYLDSDEVVCFVNLDSNAIIDSYNNSDVSAKSVSEFLTTKKAINALNKINNDQNAVINDLTAKGLIDSVERQYNTITNTIAVKTTYGDYLKLKEMDLFKSVTLSDTFNKPKAEANDASAIVNPVDVYDTGIYKSDCVDFTGKGTSVAVLDSGFDCSHTVFQHNIEEEMITASHIESVLSTTNAANSHYKGTTPLKLTDVYYSKKVPFAYDYADKDYDVFPYDSEHGTHVAGIIGGKDDVITGIAVDTQLVLLKVFPDLSEGGKTEDILAALEDAVRIGVDAINMSLGSSCGFATEEDGNFINEVYDSINKSGISLITAASNSYSSAFGGELGNTNKVTNPDSGTVGSPSTYGPSLSVASISGTKSMYVVANNQTVVFYNESNSISGKPNDFYDGVYKALGKSKDEEFELEYVTVPGVGKEVNFMALGDLKGKVALIRRGDNTFEEKAKNAKAAGALACIIYNNVEGEILMSMGKSDHIPTISISKELGTLLAKKEKGTLKFSYKNAAGPFMSDFSSWGPTPSLGIKPEITAHGGNIKSSVPGGLYDELSGTSMATPNLCGIVVLIRQYLKETYPDLSTKELSVLTNQLLMSTATIILNQEGNPYSPRKQGAGLASIYNAVNTKAYITVDGIDRPKLELLDDPMRTGKYVMEFNVENLSNEQLTYEFAIAAMTESVSTSDDDFVAEKARMLTDKFQVELISGGSLTGNTLKLNPLEKCKVKVTYQISDSDKKYIEETFPYGMYVEGFVKLKDLNEVKEGAQAIDLNIPFLAFYGDWCQAPIFDKTYYEVQAEANDGSINEEDKLKADYYATTPYGSYYYNYIIPFGTYLYDIDTNNFDPISASKDKIAISNYLGTIDGISAVYGGLLRGCRTMTFTITDKLTGEVIYEKVDYNASKAYSNGGSPYPYYEDIRVKSYELGLVNNRQYEFRMIGELDYKDGGLTTNVRNSFGFDFYADDEAPILKNVEYSKEYDKTLKKDRYYLTMTVYDNHYAQSITPIIFTSNSSYTFLTDNPIPIYSERNSDTTVKFEITDYLESIRTDSIVPSALAFSIDDYALNSNIYICQLPGTKGDFKFTKDGTVDGSDLIILSMYEKEAIDLTRYLSTTDKTVDDNKDYLKHLVWTSSNEEVCRVQDGIVIGLKPGKVTVTVEETLFGKKAVLILNIKESKTTDSQKRNKKVADDYEEATIDSIEFSYFDTLFAYSRAAQTSEIGQTGSRTYLSSLPGGISMYPGEKIQLFYNFNPWYAKDNYDITFVSKNPSVATIDQDGKLTALKKGTTIIELRVAGSNIMASVRVNVKSEFVIENRTLIAYKGLGGNVVIPDDEGILYIGAYAFCLYNTDNSFELTEDDYDANKVPQSNQFVTSVVVPEGVEEIQKYAFYNCIKLESVTLPSSIRFVREFAFYNDKNLTSINLGDVEVIGANCFKGCEKLQLNGDDISKVYSIGKNAFEGCLGLTSVNLTGLRNSGKEIFKGCVNLKDVNMNQFTKLSEGMFTNTGIEQIDIYEKVEIPEYCFSKCENLTTVTIHNSLVGIKRGAFSDCTNLNSVTFSGSVGYFGDLAFSGSGFSTFTLPNSEVELQSSVFYKCVNLNTLNVLENTSLTGIKGTTFEQTSLSEFNVSENNQLYKTSTDKKLLLSKDGKKIIFAAFDEDYTNLVLDGYDVIGASSFSGTNIKTLTITNPNIVIEDFAFSNCKSLEEVNFASGGEIKIGMHAFNYSTNLTTVNNLQFASVIKDYAFANTSVNGVEIKEGASVGEGAFFRSKIETITINNNATFELGVFQECKNLKDVVLNGDVKFGKGCFAYCTNLTNINLDNVTNIPDECFYSCTNLLKVNLNSAKNIGNYAFADCMKLMNVTLEVVETLGEGCFARYSTTLGAPVFGQIILPETLKEIKDGAFIGCEKLMDIVIPESVTSMGDYVFAYCLKLESVTLPQNITRIGKYAFAGCEILETINLKNITEIDDYAFTSCKWLEKVDLRNARTIGIGAFADTYLLGSLNLNKLEVCKDYAFQGAKLTYVSCANLREIGVGAFQNNIHLTKFEFTDKIEKVSMLAFNGCENLTKFTDTKLNDTCEINDYALLSNGVLYTKNSKGQLELTSVPANLNILTLQVLPNTVRLDTYCGNSNKNIQNIILPDGLEIIGNYAFYGYDKLKSVEFRSSVAPMLESTYNEDAKLSETDPGYELLKNQYDLFELNLAYYQFIDLCGKKKPIKMVLPLNDTLKGYDSIVYEVYFGKVEDASRGTTIAKEEYLVIFEKLMAKLQSYDQIVIEHEELINEALTACKAIKQDPELFGYTKESWNELVSLAESYLDTIYLINIKNSNYQVKEVYELMEKLPDTFSEAIINDLNNVTAKYNELSKDEKDILNTTKYQNLIEQYNEFLNPETPVDPVDPVNPDVNKPEKSGCKSAVSVLYTVGLLGLVVVFFRRKNN